MIIHGEPGSGKSTLALSGPAPRLIIDAESGAHHAHRVIKGEIELAKTQIWRPTDPIPTEVEDTCIVSVTDYSQLDPVFDQLNHSPHPFKTIIVDSITEIQQYLHERIRKDNGSEQFQQRDWGTSKTRLTTFVRNIRDLSVHETNPVPVTIFIALTADRDGKKWPNLEGGAVKNFPGSVDVVGYVSIAADEDGEEHQGLRLHGRPDIIAKTRSPLVRMQWGSVVVDPNLTEIFESIQEEKI